MKKFTWNFLFGKPALGSVFRKIGLSMVVVLMAMSVFGQIPNGDAQDTYHVFAEKVSDCYRADNDYAVEVSMRDFVEIDSFRLVLTFNDGLFSYEDVTGVHAQLGAGLSVSTVSQTGFDKLVMVWDSGDVPQTIEPNNDTTTVFVLHFSLKGFPHNVGTTASFKTALQWQGESSVWNSPAQGSEILTWYVDGGEIDVTQQWPDITVDVTTANCDGGQATATVTVPAQETGMTYSFNGETYTGENSTGLTAPSTGHTVTVKKGDCISFVKTFDVSAQLPFSYTVQDTVYVPCPGGAGDLEFDPDGGSGPFTYYIVPESDTAQVIYDLTRTGKTREQAIEYLDADGYGRDTRINQLSPGFYAVAAQDNNHCADLRDINGWWTGIVVLDTLTDWTVTETLHVDETCPDENDGAFTLTVAGATPYADGYNVLVNGVQQSSRTYTLALTRRQPGSHHVTFVDSNLCQWDTTIVINPAEPITFDVEHTDASCDLENGTIWIDTVSIVGGSGSLDTWTWEYATKPDFSDAVDAGYVTDTVTDLPGNTYYVRITDGNGCKDIYENINGDNAVKVLAIEFDLVYAPISCNGDSTDVEIIVENAANHDLGYSIDGTTYTSDKVFENLAAGTYTFYVYDSTINCSGSWTDTIGQPAELTVAVIDLLTSEPSCHDATDGHIQVRAEGGTTFRSMGETYYYQYKFDDRPWENGGEDNTFAADTGLHTIIIRDYYGCQDTIRHELYLTPNVIGLVDEEVDCFGDRTDLPNNDEASIIKSWIQEPAGQAQGQREPVIYFSEDYVTAGEITSMGIRYTDTTMFSAGDYYFAAVDEWGCLSNVDTLIIKQPREIWANAEKVKNAGCAGINDGQIKIEALYGIDRDGSFAGRYQYSFTESATIMARSDWYDQVDWHDFTNDDPANDSIVFIDVRKGTYYIGVRDSCGAKNPELIQGPFEVLVDGAEELEINWKLVDVDSVSCNVYGKAPGTDGKITGLKDATTGGWGDYEYTLDIVSGTSTRFPETNMSGEFIDLPAGDYTLTVTDDSLLCAATYDVEIGIPDALMLVTDSAYVSFNGKHDGIIRYMISGGTAPFEEATNNVGLYETVSDIPEERWYAVDSTVFDRRARAGVYQIYVRDAKGCIYGPVIDTIKQPAPLALTTVKEIEPSCAGSGVTGTTDDGEIWVIPSGGWGDYGFEYIVTIDVATAVKTTSGDTVKFSGLTASTYEISVRENNSSYLPKPLNTYTDYFEKWGAGDYNSQLPWQNSPDSVSINVDLQGPDPIVYDEVLFYNEKCYNTATGQIHLNNISGGVKPYTVWVEGPVAYRPATDGVGADTTLAVTATSYVWDDLVRGHYTVYIKDAKGCQLVKESGEIERPDSLMITKTELIANAECNGGEGIIRISAEGGVGSYRYAVDSTLVPGDGSHPFPLENLKWQDSDTFYVTAATWVAWVEDEAGCIQGYATDENGTPIQQHRVTVTEPGPILTDNLTSKAATCYGEANGSITLDSIYYGEGKGTGAGAPWDIEVTGTDYAGNVVFKEYTSTDSANIVLGSLVASTTKTDPSKMTDADKYTIRIYDSKGCVSQAYKQYVTQPGEFLVTLEDKNNAFVCPNDKAGLFEIKVVKGGTPYANGKFEYMWEAYTDAAMTEVSKVDSLTGEWGFTSTYLGYGDLYYRVSARDSNKCIATTDTFVNAPDPITFDLFEASCYGDTLASVRVAVNSPEGRKVRLLYKEILGDTPTVDTFTVHNVWFDDELDVEQVFNFDNENLQDRHYAFMLEDTLGCTTDIDTMTFDEVQHPLAADISVGETVGCETLVTVSASGGIPPYAVYIDDVLTDEMTVALGGGVHTIVVMDSHLRCEASETITLDYPMSMDTTLSVYVGDTTQFVYGTIDTMLVAEVEGETVDTFYNSIDATCLEQVVVIVDARMRTAPVLDTVTPTDTIADNHAIFTIVFEDVVTFNDSVMGYLTVTQKDSAEATLEIPVTADMVSGNTITVDYNYEIVGKLDLNTTYTVAVDSGIVMGDGLAWDGVTGTWEFTTGPDWATGVEDLQPETLEFSVYPNPFNDFIRIDNADKLDRVIVSNIAGQRILDIEYPSYEIRTGNLVTGVYVVTLISNDEIVKSERIIKR